MTMKIAITNMMQSDWILNEHNEMTKDTKKRENHHMSILIAISRKFSHKELYIPIKKFITACVMKSKRSKSI